ncbi:HNH endonuclease [Sphingomonas melonis TY]|uniref:HNH endonuclease n=1 Tax=Sphingomonas melonis TY TaxID=621456 RepID=A0A175Y328_9SPHN|nr:HNH endonuclease [Sphingomonas melonis]AOW25687.1 HNH endonuclease [Sphingomonas melonis TY]KZB95077.1 HNH endonuclease [Sphingomonas melonis TY]
MSPDPDTLAARVSAETGLAFTGSQGRERDGARWIELHPEGHPPAQTFTLRTVIGWRRLDVHFAPGAFAGDLVASMSAANDAGRRGFLAVLGSCQEDGAEVALTLNGTARDLADPTIWSTPWRSMALVIRRGMLALNEGNDAEDARIVALWAGKGAAAILALLPLESEGEDGEAEPETPDIVGLPEGAKTRIEVNRYERDRRNRAAALAIHGYVCKACDTDMGRRYGDTAVGLIEVHHVTPVSEVGAGYVIDPRTDLIPLCPNCHSVAHRRSPPFSVGELRDMLAA